MLLTFALVSGAGEHGSGRVEDVLEQVEACDTCVAQHILHTRVQVQIQVLGAV